MSRERCLRGSSTSRVRHLTPQTFVGPRSFSTRTRLSYAAVGLGATAIRKPERLPSTRCPILRSGEAWIELPVTFAGSYFAPFLPDAMKLPSSGKEPPRLATARCLGSPLGFPWRCAEDASRRLLQPISRNEHPNRSPDSRAPQLALRSTSHRGRNEPRPASDSATTGVRPPCGNPTPDERALDGAHPTSASTSRALRSPWGAALGNPFRAAILVTVCSTAIETDEETSDAPCRAPTFAPSFRPTPSSESQNRFHHSRVNASGFPGPRRLPPSSAQSSLPRSPSPPSVARLCRRAPTSDADSPSRRSRAGGLDPYRKSLALFTPRLVRAERRSWTSAILKRPASTTSNRSNPTHRMPGRPDAQLLIVGGFASFRSRGQPGGIGPGVTRDDFTPLV